MLKSSMLKRFVMDYNTVYDDFTLSLSAGYIDKDGTICNQQAGIESTFSVGMPVYTKDHQEIGRLSIGLFKSLDYSTDDNNLKIPVEFWEVKDYEGEGQCIKTYHQVNKEQL